ncbi:hypothetical protein [Subtercola sp. YIM 133946]|uniref:hypothetical protein n=1 Tax=Subtercola sp. YIM 133946 TaxID=3118909 RepID=UPI002F95B124
MFRVSQRTDDLSLLRFSTRDPLVWITPDQFGRGLASGSLRREWTWLAFVDDRPVARAVWWGPVGSVHPVELRCLIVRPSISHPELWGAAIIRSAHRAFAEAGALFAPEFVVTVEPGEQSDLQVRQAIGWRRQAAVQAGVTLVLRSDEVAEPAPAAATVTVR